MAAESSRVGPAGAREPASGVVREEVAVGLDREEAGSSVTASLSASSLEADVPLPAVDGGESSTTAWDGVELPPTATSRRRRKRGHRGGVGRRGGRRASTPDPEDDPLYPFKVQAAKDLGLWSKVEKEGWGALTSLESGRIGGYMQRLVREARAADEPVPGSDQGRIRPSSTES